MSDFDKIMVAIGFSEYATGIFNYSARLARKLDSDIVVVNIINQRDVDAVGSIADMGYDIDSDNYVESIKQERRAQLDKMIADADFPAERIKTIIKVGMPIDALLSIMVKEKVDLVVMGVKSRTDLEAFFVGSVAEKMFRRSPVPIVSYRDEKIAERFKQYLKV